MYIIRVLKPEDFLKFGIYLKLGIPVACNIQTRVKDIP
jgi:hypothetical protein